MKKNISIVFLLAICLFFTACGSNDTSDEILKFTTDKTLSVAKVNLKSLDEKFPKEELLNDKNDQKLSKTDKENLQLLFDAKNNGIDIDKSLYIMVDDAERNIAVSALFWLNDIEKFQTSFSTITETKILIKEDQLIYSDNEIIGSVNDKLVVLSKLGNEFSNYSGSSDKIDTEFYTNFWKRKPLENKNRIEQIQSSLDNNADVSAWINIHGLISKASNGYIETLAINKTLIDAGISINATFKKGKIVAVTNTYFNDDLKKIVEKYYKGKEINYNIVKNIDIDNAKMYSVGYLSLDFINHFIKEAGVESVINNNLASQNLTLDDITNAFTGDYIFVHYPETKQQANNESEKVIKEESDTITDEDGDEIMEEDEITYSSKQENNFIVGLGINNEKASKIINFIKEDAFGIGATLKTFNNKEVLVFSSQDKNIELFKNDQKAANKKLKKESGLNSYTWNSGLDINTVVTNKTKAKVKEMISTSKVDNGNFFSETRVLIDKDDKNILHYLMGYE